MAKERPSMINHPATGGLPALSSLPIFSPELETINRRHIIGFETRNADSRPFNLLRTQVSKKCTANGWSVIGVTSAEPAAGKSFVSLNLAASMARVGDQPVYLLDLDLTRASVARYMGMTPEFGLSDYLSGEVDSLSALGWRVEATNLAVFPTVHPVRNNAELLSGPHFRSLIDTIRAHDGQGIVICDLPPAFANDDAMIVIQQLDAYLLVVDGSKTTRRQVIESRAMFEPTPLLGTVLNRYQGGVTDPYGYSGYSQAYRKYY
ncbi:CpsD/CapB family tyrosine-protein kinase [Sphingomonas sp. M1-B02]|uniref:CpsD/CapB family tyrosine-protein kinase n=1 Tax=Sphingomonas sp. M1-B02 TaxID=3114300 RepID=UPI002240AB89|nr:CpsD/CapB family tyrosine-protein kinase [Sphingomonas sp. S6-11]UZK67735.1 CpsD/CapB family tyrosine-protein kinase [Sphingomonas sp. S6-11]